MPHMIKTKLTCIAVLLMVACTSGYDQKPEKETVRRQGSRRGGSGPWYDNEAEYVYAENLVLMALVCVAVFWELVHHLVHHAIENYSGGYGVKKAFSIAADAHEHSEEKGGHGHEEGGHSHDEDGYVTPMGGGAHYVNLFARFSAEAMILGFMAFTVWTCSQCKVWDKITKSVNHHHLTPSALLHMVEAVHMQIFMAMVLQFIAMAWVIHRSMVFQRELRGAFMPDTAVPDNVGVEATASNLGTQDPHVIQMAIVSDFFVRTVHTAVPEIRPEFDMSRYLAVSLDNILKDLTFFSPWTWFSVMCFEAVTCVLAFLWESKNDSFMWQLVVMSAVAMVPVVAIFIWARVQKCWILSTGAKLQESTSVAAHLDTESRTFKKSILNDKFPLRLMQACSFIISYSMISLVGAARFYDGDWGGVYGDSLNWEESSFYWFFSVVLWVLMLGLQADTVITCTLVLSLPPFVDAENEKLARKVVCAVEDAERTQFEQAAKILGLPLLLVQERLQADYLELRPLVSKSPGPDGNSHKTGSSCHLCISTTAPVTLRSTPRRSRETKHSVLCKDKSTFQSNGMASCSLPPRTYEVPGPSGIRIPLCGGGSVVRRAFCERGARQYTHIRPLPCRSSVPAAGQPAAG